jgi:hypothetical protein
MAILVRPIGRAAIGRPGSTTWCGRLTTHVIDQGQTRRRRFWSMVSGRRQSDTERGIGSDQTLNVEGRVRGECRDGLGLVLQYFATDSACGLPSAEQDIQLCVIKSQLCRDLEPSVAFLGKMPDYLSRGSVNIQ